MLHLTVKTLNYTETNSFCLENGSDVISDAQSSWSKRAIRFLHHVKGPQLLEFQVLPSMQTMKIDARKWNEFTLVQLIHT